MRQPHTVLYARKSHEDDDRQVLSLDAQEKECRAFAARHGLVVDEVVREAHSARRPGRPLFNSMLGEVRSLQVAGTPVRILCHKPDRLLRNLADWARINDLMEGGVELIFVTGSYPNNAQGKMAFGINVVFAKYYVDNLSEEVRKGFREKLARGEWPHKAPLGYRNEQSRIVLDPLRAPLVRRAFEYYASGEYSLNQLSDRLYAEGLGGRRLGRKLSKNVLATHLLSNPFYCGLLRTGGNLYPASHPPLISPELYERVQQQLRRVGRPQRARHDFPLRGLLSCGSCGAMVVGERKKGRYTYYRCSHKRGPCSEGYVREEELCRWLAAALRDLLTLPEELPDVLRETARVMANDERDTVSQQEPLQRQLDRLRRKRDALVDLRLEGGISEEEYRSKREGLLLEQGRLDERLNALELSAPDYERVVEEFLRICEQLETVAQEFEPDDFRHLLRTVGSNYRLTAGKVDFEPVKPFDLAVRVRNRSVWRGNQDQIRTAVDEITSYAQPGLQLGKEGSEP